MSPRRPSRNDIRLLCIDLDPEDGIDPRFLRRPHDRAPKRKTLQLCNQAREALIAVLGDCADEALRDLTVEAVTPAGGGRLLVTLRPSSPDLQPTQDHLSRAHGLLRREVASAVHRRKAPELVFQVLVPSGG